MNTKRHELKYLINNSDYLTLKRKLDLLLKRDEHSIESPYLITSIYFDDLNNKAYYQKVNGDSYRYKYRIRFYNNNKNLFKLEKKSKLEQITSKTSVYLNRDEVDDIMNKNYKFLLLKNNNLCAEFYLELSRGLLKPKVVVEYERLAYVHKISDLRITFDTNIKSSFNTTDLLEKDCIYTNNLEEENIVMEIKSNGDIPVYLKSILQLGKSTQTSMSKYVYSRKYNYNL